MGKRLTTEEFIKRSKEIFEDKYDYSKTQYINNKRKVILICPEHGEFEQLPNNHLAGKNCPECGKISMKQKLTGRKYSLYTKEEIQNKIDNIHGNIKIIWEYVNTRTHTLCKCTECQYEWEPIPDKLLQGRGCPNCSKRIKGTVESLQKQLIDNNKNFTILGSYTNRDTPTLVKCNDCGYEWEVRLYDLIHKQSCPKCSKSKGETSVENYLKQNNINYIDQYPIEIDSSINKSGKARLDFYLPDYNIVIEYNGIQHYIPREYFGGQLQFEHQQKRDEFVRQYCKCLL